MFNRHHDQASNLRRMMAAPKPLVLTMLSVLNSDRSTRMMRDFAVSLSRQGSEILVVNAKSAPRRFASYYEIKEIPCLMDFTLGKTIKSQRRLASTPGLSLTNLFAEGKNNSHYDQNEMNMLNQQFQHLTQETEIILVDAQLTEQQSLPLAALNQSEIIIQLDQKAASITQAYQLIKVLNQQQQQQNFSVLICDATEAQAQKVFQNLAQAALTFLQVKLNFFGIIPDEPKASLAYAPSRSVVDVFPSAAISLALNKIALKLGVSNAPYPSSMLSI
jgi:flagellar biosynthesis protein FlhG